MSAGWTPSATQELLFQAALMPAEIALPAWQEWNRRVDLIKDDLESDSFMMLSQVYDNLQAHMAFDPLGARLKGISRYHWTKTQLSLSSGANALRILRAHGISTMLLKGAALVSAGLIRPVVRAMYDVDVLVPHEHRPKALDALMSAGWRSKYPIPESRYPFIHSLDLVSSAGTGLDLHWFALSETCQPGIDVDFWAGAVQTALNGEMTLRPNNGDLLFHVLAHGARWDPAPSRRWVADAAAILWAGEPIDWARVVELAQRRELTLQTAAMLGYVRRTFAIAVPDEALDRLGRVPASRGERIEFWSRSRQQRRLRGMLFHTYHYWRLTRGPHAVRVSPVRYLQDWWGISRRRDLPAVVLERGMKRLVKRRV